MQTTQENQTNLTGEIRAFIQKNYLFGDAATLGDEDSFMENSVMDSTGVLELVAFLEKTYGIRIGDTDLMPENLDSIQRVAAFVQRSRNAQ
jgi:acyl carrier protein